jgi:alginate export protein
MWKTALIVAVALVVAAIPAFAELQNVQVGGEIRINGNYVRNWAVHPGPLEIRLPAFFTPFRALGTGAGNGLGLVSPYAFNDKTNAVSLVEQRTRLNFTADFTNDVRAFIELESYDWWGEDFRSNYVTGADARANSVDDVEMYQAYIEADNMWGIPLRMRVGRQELAFGSQWLVGPKDFGPWFRGRSFDAIRLTYTHDVFSVDAWASILAEGGIAEEDEDVWFYGVYGSYNGIENLTIDAYWMLLRDARSLNDTNFVAPIEWLEDVFDLDDYDVTNLHTVGLRAAGQYGPVDFDIEAAYQFGEMDQVGFNAKPFLYGDDGADAGVWGVTAEVGYSMDIMWQPRIFAKYVWLQGEDNRDISFVDWINPFDRPEASVSFNRLFSNHFYGGFLDLNNDFSNGHMFQVGAMAHPTEAIDVCLDVAFFQADEAFDMPAHVSLLGLTVPLAPALPWWDDESSKDLGWQTHLVLVYHYSEDLSFNLHWSHLFTGQGLDDGSFNTFNGTVFSGGSDADDADYISLETRLAF